MKIDRFTLSLAKKYTDEHGGGGGTSNYNSLSNKPKINNVELSGNKTLKELGVPLDTSDLTNGAGFITENDIPAIPEKTSDLTNDSGFITKSVDDLTNYTTTSEMNTALSGKVSNSSVGTAGGVAELDNTGKVPSSQLPSYVVDGYYNETDGKFYEESSYTTEIPGEAGKIYISVDTDIQYRWTGSAFSALGGALVLGETSSTAYRGDRGKAAYDISQTVGDVSDLDTTDKSSVINAINEVYGMRVPCGFTPIGTVISYMGTTAPQNYLACDDTTYNIADYPELAAFFEAQFGSKNYFGGDGTTTFKCPDLRGEFLRGTGTNGHTNQGSGANIGEHQDGTEHVNVISDGGAHLEMPSFSPVAKANNVDSTIGSSTFIARDKSTNGGINSNYYTSRPTNTSVLYCIAYKDIQISLDDNRPIQAALDRWLRFDPENRKGLIIKAGTSILKSNKQYKTFYKDTKVDFTTDLTSTNNGKDFFVYLLDDDSVVVSLSKLTMGVEIGRFHTLCADAGANLTMTLPASPSSGLQVGGKILVKSYKALKDPDFYIFYNKTITAVSVGTPYDVITCEHPLSGYSAGDILPESVFCETFYPDCVTEDAMVYDKDTDIAVDVYLQSGTGYNTRSAFNATHTVSRQSVNHAADFMAVGKRMLFYNEFTSIARGSNETTNITGSSDKGTVGGHVDTANRRMVSAIGCEECCGYLFQWLNDLTGWEAESWGTRDGRGSFGLGYRDPLVLLAGGDWVDESRCGSVCLSAKYPRSTVNAHFGGRGCKPITKSASAPKNSLVEAGNNYSTEEKIVGTWIDGKPLYQKTVSTGGDVPTGATLIQRIAQTGNDTLLYTKTTD